MPKSEIEFPSTSASTRPCDEKRSSLWSFSSRGRIPVHDAYSGRCRVATTCVQDEEAAAATMRNRPTLQIRCRARATPIGVRAGPDRPGDEMSHMRSGAQGLNGRQWPSPATAFASARAMKMRETDHEPNVRTTTPCAPGNLYEPSAVSEDQTPRLGAGTAPPSPTVQNGVNKRCRRWESNPHSPEGTGF